MAETKLTATAMAKALAREKAAIKASARALGKEAAQAKAHAKAVAKANKAGGSVGPVGPLEGAARFKSVFEEMARHAAQNNNESIMQMTQDGVMLIVFHRDAGNYSCQAMEQSDQWVFMEHLHRSLAFEPPLRAAYSEEAVDAFERANSVSLPGLLRYYLTHISSESCCDPERMLIDISSPPSRKVFVTSGNGDSRTECSTLRYTHNKLIVLNSDMAGLVVTTDTASMQGEFNPLWMSVFFPDVKSVRGA